MTIPAGPLCTSLSTISKAPKWSFNSRGDNPAFSGAKDRPGPGQYGNPDFMKMGRYSRAPTPTFTHTPRDLEIGSTFNVKPGVGTYTPATSYTLSQAPRMAFPKSSRDDAGSVFGNRPSTPGPGSYSIKPALAEVSTTLKGRPTDRARPSTPGPGAYATPRGIDGPAWKMGTGQRPALNASLARAQSPGPGHYPNMTAVASRHPTLNTAPGYSMVPRRDARARSLGPGPGAHGGAFTTFGY